MAITVDEHVESRRWVGENIETTWIVRGTASEVDARAALLGAGGAPATLNSLPRTATPTLEAEWVESVSDDGLWRCDVLYEGGRRTGQIDREPLVADEQVIEWNATVVMAHTTVSEETVAAYGTAAAVGDYGNLIGVTDDGAGSGTIEGTDMPVPEFRFTVRCVFASGSLPTPGTIYGLVGRVNVATFAVQDTQSGKSLSFDAGECRLDGSRGGLLREDGAQEIEYQFTASPNRTGISVYDINDIAKGGFDYLWTRNRLKVSGTLNILVMRPVAVYVERTHLTGDFSALNLIAPP